MELKQNSAAEHTRQPQLLIVPYGIETRARLNNLTACFRLLIVPYGIETRLLEYKSATVVLLIVPYGIETCAPLEQGRRKRPFNRTLWN